jgi:hypothetical protein
MPPPVIQRTPSIQNGRIRARKVSYGSRHKELVRIDRVSRITELYVRSSHSCKGCNVVLPKLFHRPRLRIPRFPLKASSLARPYFRRSERFSRVRTSPRMRARSDGAFRGGEQGLLSEVLIPVCHFERSEKSAVLVKTIGIFLQTVGVFWRLPRLIRYFQD